MESQTKREIKDPKTKFWSRWERADRPSRTRILSELPGIPYPFIDYLNFYLEGLYDYIVKKYELDNKER